MTVPFSLRAVLVDADDLVADGDLAAGDFAVGDTAEVIAVIEIGDEHLEVLVGIRGRAAESAR